MLVTTSGCWRLIAHSMRVREALGWVNQRLTSDFKFVEDDEEVVFIRICFPRRYICCSQHGITSSRLRLALTSSTGPLATAKTPWLCAWLYIHAPRHPRAGYRSVHSWDALHREASSRHLVSCVGRCLLSSQYHES